MRKFFNKLLLSLKNKLFFVGGLCCIGFALIGYRFYTIQIVNHDYYETLLTNNVQRKIKLPADRGSIFDRNGRALAINQPEYMLLFDLQKMQDRSERQSMFLKINTILCENGDSPIDHIPISKSTPFFYTDEGSGRNRFLNGMPYSNTLQRQELAAYSAEEVIAYLADQFGIDSSYSLEEKRTIIGFEYELYSHTYKKYEKVKLAHGLSSSSVASLQTLAKSFHSLMLKTENKRYYPCGEVISNTLGYIKEMTSDQYISAKNEGYEVTDKVGQMGIEKSMESYLRGTDGYQIVEVDAASNLVQVIDTKEPVAGDDIYLTIDYDMQLVAYESLEKHLIYSIIDRLENKIDPLLAKDVMISMINCNQLDWNEMQKAEKGTYQFKLYQALTERYLRLDPIIAKQFDIQDLLIEWLKEDASIQKQVILALAEQGVIKISVMQLRSYINECEDDLQSIIIRLFKSESIKPSQLDFAFCSGAVVMVDINTGQVLCTVSYPAYDNNRIIDHFNEYWSAISQDDRSLLWNRATKTTKAPGSVFKMITAIAALEEHIITTDTIINDEGTYTKAGAPYPKCWIASNNGTTHGAVDVRKALEVSCNYFFYEISRQLDLATDEPYGSVRKLSEYASMLGLDRLTGIEIEESKPKLSNPETLLKDEINQCFNRFLNEGTVQREERRRKIKLSLSKGILGEISIGSNRTLLNQEAQKNLAEKMEPLAQKQLESHYDELIEELFNTLNDLLKNRDEFIEKIIFEAMDQRSISLEEEVRNKLYDAIDCELNKAFDEIVKNDLKGINDNLRLDVYEIVLTDYYRQLIRQDNEEVAKSIKNKIAHLKDDWNKDIDVISLKIRQNMINIIVNDLLDGVKLNWSDGITVRSAIGQGYNAFSPIQIARYIAAIANGQYVNDLTLIKGIYNYKKLGYTDNNEVNKVVLDLNEDTRNIVVDGMIAVTNGEAGTARNQFEEMGIDVAAKTGTAEEGNHAHSWFTGFAPVISPQVGFVVTLYYTDDLPSYGQDIAKDLLNAYFNKTSRTSLMIE